MCLPLHLSGPDWQASGAQGQAAKAVGDGGGPLFPSSLQQPRVMTPGSDSLRGSFLSHSHGQCP